jgi:hypothetical protein
MKSVWLVFLIQLALFSFSHIESGFLIVLMSIMVMLLLVMNLHLKISRISSIQIKAHDGFLIVRYVPKMKRNLIFWAP